MKEYLRATPIEPSVGISFFRRTEHYNLSVSNHPIRPCAYTLTPFTSSFLNRQTHPKKNKSSLQNSMPYIEMFIWGTFGEKNALDNKITPGIIFRRQISPTNVRLIVYLQNILFIVSNAYIVTSSNLKISTLFFKTVKSSN